MKKLENVKAHIREHKVTYIVGVGGVTVGIAVGAIVTRNPSLIKTTIFGNHNTVNNIVVSALGDPGNVVQCLETGTIYASQGQAAREFGVSAARMSDHLSGKLPHIKDMHLKVIGKAGEVLA